LCLEKEEQGGAKPKKESAPSDKSQPAPTQTQPQNLPPTIPPKKEEGEEGEDDGEEEDGEDEEEEDIGLKPVRAFPRFFPTFFCVFFSRFFSFFCLHLQKKSLEYISCPEDDEFAKMLEAMTAEDRESRKSDRISSTPASVTIPMGLFKKPEKPLLYIPPGGGPKQLNDDEDDGDGEENYEDEGGKAGNHVPFKLLVKKGNKQKAVDIAIPQETALASQYLKLKQKQAEQQEVKFE
jgi:hypothetical protein